MTLMTLTKRMVFAAIILLASGCSESTNIFTENINSGDLSVNQKILSTVAQESKDALQSVLRTTRLDLLNQHRKELLAFDGLDTEKENLRSKLKDVRKLVHIRHAQLLQDYQIKSAQRIGEIVLSSL